MIIKNGFSRLIRKINETAKKLKLSDQISKQKHRSQKGENIHTVRQQSVSRPKQETHGQEATSPAVAYAAECVNETTPATDTPDRPDTVSDCWPLETKEIVPDEILNNLPSGLANVLSYQDMGPKRDLFFTAAIPVIAACLPSLRIMYGSLRQSVNLYTCVIASAGAGKGKMRLARLLGEPIHLLLKRFQHCTADNISDDSAQTTSACSARSRLFIGGDASAAAMKEAISSNPTSVIFETEIATLSTVMKQEWGGLRDILLKSFHNENVTVERKDQPTLEIAHPALSIVLSGTPNSLGGIINGLEDGLFSRFSFYELYTPIIFGYDISESTRKQRYRILRVYFSWCVRHGYLATSPLNAVPIPRSKR